MSRTGKVGVGVIGTGMISDQYLQYMTKYPDLEVVAIGDLLVDRAAAQAEKFGVALSGDAATVLENPDIEIVVNLTIPAAHVPVSISAIEAGKHVWSEKPIGVNRQEAARLVQTGNDAGVRVGIAPDTVLGPGVQAARRAIARGDIGTPLSAITMMQHAGPDLFHPAPEFLFAKGGGPLYDMGPYYLTMLAHIFGSVDRVQAIGQKAQQTRTVKVGDRAGTEFPVDVFTNVAALIEFESGGSSQSTFSFDSPIMRSGFVEILGTEGTIVVPDPNNFTGEVKITRGADMSFDGGKLTVEQVWDQVAVDPADVGRGLGVLNMARAIRSGGEHIATGEVGYHVLDTIIAIDEAMASREPVKVESSIEAVPFVDEGFDAYAETL